MKKSSLILIVVLFVSLMLNVWQFNKGGMECAIINDTIRVAPDTILKHDTIVLRCPKVVNKTIIDTIMIPCKEKEYVFLDIVSKKYEEKGRYALSISGVEPLSLDSITIYEPTKIIETKEYIYRNVVDKKMHYYCVFDLSQFKSELIPSIGIHMENHKKFSYGAKIGIYDGSLILGANVAYKIK